MKKIFSLILAGAAVILISVCAFAAENIDKFFVLKAGDGVAAYEAAAFASENGFDGILVDCRNGYSEDYIDSLLSSTDGIRLFALCRSDSAAVASNSLTASDRFLQKILNIFLFPPRKPQKKIFQPLAKRQDFSCPLEAKTQRKVPLSFIPPAVFV